MSKSNSDEKRYNFQEVPKNKAVQYDELDKILLKLTGSKGVNRRSSVTGEKRNEAKRALLDWHNKQVEKVNKTTNSVDLTKPEVNLIDIASPNMTPEADKVVSDAIERSAETMNNTVEEAENIRLTRAEPIENGELELGFTNTELKALLATERTKARIDELGMITDDHVHLLSLDNKFHLYVLDRIAKLQKEAAK